jgi:hypothetical protein
MLASRARRRPETEPPLFTYLEADVLRRNLPSYPKPGLGPRVDTLGGRLRQRVARCYAACMFTATNVLDQLDQCAEDFTFPMLDNGYVYPAGVRLSSFRDDRSWAVIIEAIGYNPRGGGHNGIANCLYCFGNCLARSPGTANEDFLYLTGDGADGVVFDTEYDSIVLPEAKSIRIRGQSISIGLTQAILEDEGIGLAEPPDITAADLLRYLMRHHRRLLLATQEELERRLSHAPPPFLTLNEWNHPDLSKGERPSQSETFQMLAKALETGDRAYYAPGLKPNTDWRNWPEGGTL